MLENNFNKVLVIGLDGATFRVIDPLIKMGKLPNIERLIKEGAHGNLQSTIPPITGPAWLSFATGKSPAKTGIYDFTIPKEGKINLTHKPIGSINIYQNGATWDYLSRVGRKIIIYNYPMLFPPYEINGCMVSGLGSLPEDEITYPKNLKDEIEGLISEYRIDIPWSTPQYKDNVELFLKHANELLEMNWKVTKFLMRNKKWDLFIAIFSATDFVQHVMWKYWDNVSFEYQKNNLYRTEFIRFWERVDEIIGEISSLTDEGAN